jgi:hypothetical protein
MHRTLVGSVLAAVIGALCAGVTLAEAAPATAPRPDRLDAYTAVVTASQLSDLAQQGLDLGGRRTARGGVELDLVLDLTQAARLRERGIDLRLTRVKGGQTVRQFAAAQAAGGFTVWRSFDEPGGIRDQMHAAARRNPQLVKLVRLGTTYQGREILASS